MSSLLSLLARVREDPEDDAPRLILADWLEEHGNESEQARAELIRLQCQQGRIERSDPRWAELERRENQLVEQHKQVWLEPFDEVFYIRRGLLSVGFSEEDQPSDELLANDSAWAWVYEAGLYQSTWGSGPVGLLASPQIRWLTVLGFAEGCPDEGLSVLAASPHTTQLRCLWCCGGQLSFSPGALCALLRSPYLTCLETLDLSFYRGAADWASSLADTSLPPQLHTLKLFRAYLGDIGVNRLVRSPQLRQLHTLHLQTTGLTDEGARTLASADLDGLQSLLLEGNRITEEGVRLLQARFGDRVSC